MCKIAARSLEISQFSLSVNINTCGTGEKDGYPVSLNFREEDF